MLRCLALALLVLLAVAPPALAGRATLEMVPVDGGPRTLLDRHEEPSNGFTGVAWTPDASAVVAIGEAGRHNDPILRRHVPDGSRTASVIAPLAGVIEASVAPDGATVTESFDHASWSRRGGVLVRDVATGAVRARVPQVAEGDDLYESPPAVCWSRDGSRVAILAEEHAGVRLRVIDTRTGAVLLRTREAAPTGAECFGPGGTQLLVTRPGRSVESPPQTGVLDVATGAFRRLPSWGRIIAGAAWSPDGALIAIGDDSDIAIVDAVTGWGPSYPAGTVDGDEVRTLRWAPDGRSVAAVVASDEDEQNPDELVVLGVTPNGAPRVLVQARTAGIGTFAWAPDGRRIAFATARYGPWPAPNGRAGTIPLEIVSGR